MTIVTENPDLQSCRHVVMIAAAFPPTGGPGVQRVGKFAKFLPRLGWQPHVWAVDGMAEFPVDETLLDDLPDCVVVHRRKAGGAMRAVHEYGARLSSGIAWRLEQWMSARSFPDAYGSWARSSVAPLEKLSARHRFEAIFSSFSPASNHWLAMNLAERTGLPWIADFRDLWTDDYRYNEPDETRRRAHLRLQQQFLERADRVIGVTSTQTAMLANHVPEQHDKFVTIRNGFDPADFAAASMPAHDDSKRFVLGYVGRLDRRRVPEAFLAGLKKLAHFLGDTKRRFVFRVVGHVGDSMRKALSDTGVFCEFLDYVPHAQAIFEMRSATALLVVVPMGTNSDTTIPAKPYEYLASGRPILHIGPEAGQCAALIRTCDAGVAVPVDGDRISCAMIDYFNRWQAGDTIQGCPPSRLAAYDRAKQTGRLADLLNTVASRDGQASHHAARADRIAERAGAAS